MLLWSRSWKTVLQQPAAFCSALIGDLQLGFQIGDGNNLNLGIPMVLVAGQGLETVLPVPTAAAFCEQFAY